VAPFDGVVTSRSVDVGALIDAGAGTGRELFRLARTDKLRVYMQVPQSAATNVSIGMQAELRMRERPALDVPATLVRTAQAIDSKSRTLTAELEADNSRLEVLPGSYVDVHLKLPNDTNTLRVPINTLLYRVDGVKVATVDSDKRIRLKAVTLGRDFGTEIEVAAGLNAEDVIVISPQDWLEDQQLVHIAANDPVQSSQSK
jgi:RND family efflux transporter MFP subunit